jgi:hypothetical protein
MTTDKIYVDASQPAILRDLGGTFACATLREAMIAWDQLPDKGNATIQVGGQTYTANEIAGSITDPSPKLRPVSNLRHFLVRPDLGTCSTRRKEFLLDAMMTGTPKPPPCPSCAQTMRLARITSRFGDLPDLYTFECQACDVWHVEADEAATSAAIP